MSAAHPTSSNPLAAYLAGRRPAPNGRGLDDGALLAANLALAAELGPRFLRPDVDVAAERRAADAYEAAPAGAAAETMAARGLLPPELEAPRAFDLAFPAVGLPPRGGLSLPPAWAADPARDPDLSLVALVGLWPAVRSALALLDEAAARFGPWGWRPRQPRVVVMRTYDAASFLNTACSYPTRDLRLLLSDTRAERRRWPSSAAITFGEQSVSAAHNPQVRIFIGGHTLWRAHVAAGSPIAALAPPRRAAALRERLLSDLPDPFAPLVDVLRLGLAPVFADVGGPQLVLLVPESPRE